MDTAQEKGDKSSISETVYYKWLGAAVLFQQRNELMNHRCVELHSKLSSSGFKSTILKGQGIAVCYGELKNFRHSGDIDVYVDCEREGHRICSPYWTRKG